MSGRGTAGGVGYQAAVAAFIGALMLADRPMARLSSSLIGAPRRILLETGTAVDDVVIETDAGGVAYVQGKRTISLSEPKDPATPADSDIASVADQFVRQFRAGKTVDGVHERLTPLKDRLVLAVSGDTSGPIARHLKEALERRATKAETEMPANLVDALKTWTTHLKLMWRLAAGVEATAEEIESVLDLCRVVVLGDATEALAVDILRDVVAVPGDEASLWSDLNSWGVDASANGTGATLATLRQQLAGKTKLSAPPSYRDDVRTLRAYSDDTRAKLARFGFLPTPDGEIVVERRVVDAALAAVAGGSFLVTGEPGAGKSAVLHALAERLAHRGAVVMLSVDAAVTSLDTLRSELGLTHPITQVFAHAGDGRPAYLLVDALDAARGGSAEGAYRKLIEAVKHLDGWRVVASVRSFDLRLGRQFQEVFAGAPADPEFADPTFGRVRHLHVPLLTDAEFTDVGRKAPAMAKALDLAGEKLRTLTRNAFNLALLADLLSSGVTSGSLAGVASRGQLLERYWQERLDDRGAAAEAAVSRLVEGMLAARGTELALASTDPSWGAELDEAERRGVLVKTPGRRLAFRHHVLFDYAVARQVLSPDPVKALERLDRDADGGLLLAPSLGFWLEERLRLDPPDVFWRFAQKLLGGARIDPIAKVESGRLIAELVTDAPTLAPLAAAALKDPIGDPGAAALHLIGSVLTRLSGGLETPARPWALFADQLQPSPDRLIANLRALVASLVETPDEVSRQALGRAARSLFDVAFSSTTINERFLASLISLLTDTYGTDPAETKQRLLKIFEPTRFARLGFHEAPALARTIATIIKADPDTAATIYRQVFSADGFRRDQATSMSDSYIMGFTSNAGQDFDSAKYSLGEAFPGFLENHPALASTVLAAIFEAEAVREAGSLSGKDPVAFTVSGDAHAIRADFSEVWAWDADDRAHEDWAKMLRAYLVWAKQAPEAPLKTGLGALIGAAVTGLSWRLAIMVLAERPETLVAVGWPLASHPVFVQDSGVQHWAIRAIDALYPLLEANQRSAYEASLHELEVPNASDPAAAGAKVAAMILAAVGNDQLMTEAARTQLTQARDAGLYLENDLAFSCKVSSRALERREWMNGEGHDLVAGPNGQALDVAEAIEDLLGSQDPLNAEQLVVLDSQVDGLAAIAKAHGEAFPKDVARAVYNEIARGVARLRQSYGPADPRLGERLQQLIEISRHPLPASGAEVEDNFARSRSWGTPAPRIAAAKALAALASQPDLWPELAPTIERLLLEDAHPAVRYLTATAIPALLPGHPDDAWRLAGGMAEKEHNPSVLSALSMVLQALCQQDPARGEALVLKVLAQRGAPTRQDVALFSLLAWLAFDRDLAKARMLVAAWLAEPLANAEALRALTVQLRDALAEGYDDPDVAETDGRIARRQRTQAFVLALTEACAPTIEAYLRVKGEASAAVVTAVKMIDFLADELYFAVGAPRDARALSIASAYGQRQFVLDMRVLIARLAQLGTPHALYHLLQMLGGLIAAAPGEAFDLVAGALLRPTGVGRYEHEPLGAPVFVELVGVFLADHRELFEDPGRRRALVDCLAVFVEAGWAEARRLLQSLPELLA